MVIHVSYGFLHGCTCSSQRIHGVYIHPFNDNKNIFSFVSPHCGRNQTASNHTRVGVTPQAGVCPWTTHCFTKAFLRWHNSTMQCKCMSMDNTLVKHWLPPSDLSAAHHTSSKSLKSSSSSESSMSIRVSATNAMSCVYRNRMR